MVVLSHKDINYDAFIHYIRTNTLVNPPFGIIPPKFNKVEEWEYVEAQPTPYIPEQDYDGRLIVEVRNAIMRTLIKWGNRKDYGKVAVWLGGNDSALVTKLTADVLGSNRVVAYMITFGSQDESEYGKIIADWCDIKLVTKEMNPTDYIKLVKETTLYQRTPTTSSQVVFVSKLIRSHGINKAFTGMSLDSLTGGERRLNDAPPEKFAEAEQLTMHLMRTMYAWLNYYPAIPFTDLEYPCIDRKFVKFCRSLPKEHKIRGQETKVRLRHEMEKFEVLPKSIVEYGRMVGTKKGFCPIWKDWWNEGVKEWVKEQIDLIPRDLFPIEEFKWYLKPWNISKFSWIVLRLASVYSFHELLNEEKFIA